MPPMGVETITLANKLPACSSHPRAGASGFSCRSRSSTSGARAREASQHANEVLKITIVAFDAGSSTNIEVIDAQRSARDLDTAVVQVEDALRQARLELLVAPSY